MQVTVIQLAGGAWLSCCLPLSAQSRGLLPASGVLGKTKKLELSKMFPDDMPKSGHGFWQLSVEDSVINDLRPKPINIKGNIKCIC